MPQLPSQTKFINQRIQGVQGQVRDVGNMRRRLQGMQSPFGDQGLMKRQARGQLRGAEADFVQRRGQLRRDLGNQMNVNRAAQGELEALRDQRRVSLAQDEALGALRGSRTLSQDPIDQLIRDQLSARISGDDVPFDDATRAAILSGASNQSAAAEAAQLRNLSRRGGAIGGPGSPAFEAQRAEIQAGRQGANQEARRSLDAQSRLANFSAQGNAIAQGASVRATERQQQAQADRALAQFLSNINATDDRDTSAQRRARALLGLPGGDGTVIIRNGQRVN